MEFKISIILFLSFVTSLINSIQNEQIQNSPCLDGWLYLNAQKCILYSHKKFNFTNAQAFCKRNLNSNLITITTRDENKQLTKLLYDELQFDEYFWLNGRITDRLGNFRWLNSCVPAEYKNFHLNNHEFNVNEAAEEYLVLSSALNENVNSKRKKEVLGALLNHQLCFLQFVNTICQVQVSQRPNAAVNLKKKIL